MNSTREICRTAQRAIIERIALIYSGFLPFGAQGVHGENDDFGLLHDLWALKHYPTYKLV